MGTTPSLTKGVAPNPQGQSTEGRGAHESVLVGDSVTDIQVSRATGIRSIGFAKTPICGRELHAAGADAVTDSVLLLADLIRRSGRA